MVESELKSGSATYSSAIEDAENYTRWILSHFDQSFGSSIMEVGLGHGSYRRFLPSDINYTGIDIDPESIDIAKQRYPHDHFIQADICDSSLATLLDGRNIDSILCVNVLEHIKDDKNAINNMLSLLPSNGHLLLFVPAFPSLYTEMDSLAGHFRRYTLKHLPQLLPDNANIVESSYFNFIGGIGWWLNRFFKHSSLDNDAINNQIVFFDRYLVPVSRFFDFFTGKFFGQSLLCVIRKN